MPIFEFKCMKCSEYLEVLVMKKDEEVEMKCTQCGSNDLERILSSTNYAMTGGGGGAKAQPSTQNRTCSSGSCTTYNLPGPD